MHNANEAELVQVAADSKKLLNCFTLSGSHAWKLLQAAARNKKTNMGTKGERIFFPPVTLGTLGSSS